MNIGGKPAKELNAALVLPSGRCVCGVGRRAWVSRGLLEGTPKIHCELGRFEAVLGSLFMNVHQSPELNCT